MTVAELISELMRYGPMAEVMINTEPIKDVIDINQGDIILIRSIYE